MDNHLVERRSSKIETSYTASAGSNEAAPPAKKLDLAIVVDSNMQLGNKNSVSPKSELLSPKLRSLLLQGSESFDTSGQQEHMRSISHNHRPG